MLVYIFNIFLLVRQKDNRSLELLIIILEKDFSGLETDKKTLTNSIGGCNLK